MKQTPNLLLSLSLSTLAACHAAAASGDAAPQSAPVADLGTVLVEGAAVSKYRPDTVNSGSFTDLPPEALPVTVDTLTSDFIREHNPTDVHDLLRFVPGIETGGKSLLVRSPGQFSVRGMGGSEPAFDGLFPIGRGPGLFMDAFLMDRVEIAKGPVGALAGGAGASQNASGAGGSVNMYLKSAALGADRTEVQENTTAGRDTWRLRAMGDSNRTVDGGAGAVRLAGTADWYEPAYANKGSQKGASARESYAAAPSAVYAFSDEVTAGVKSLFQFTEQPSYIGVPVWRGKAGGGYDLHESSCLPGDRSSYKSFMVNPWLDWLVRDGWTLKFGASAMVSEWDQTTREPYTAMPGTPEFAEYCRTGAWPSGRKYMTSNFSESSAIMHNYAAFVRSTWDGELSSAATNSLLVQPDYNYRSSSGGFGTPTSRYGVTAQDAVTWRALTVLAGARYDRFEQSAYSSGRVRYRHMSADAVSPRAGASLRPTDWLVLFGNLSQTQTPMLGLRCEDGSTPDDPWRATQYEGGFRLRPAEKLWFSFSGYRIDQEHVPEFDNTGIVLDWDGKTASQGVEASLSGDVTDDLTLMLMYAHNHYTDRNAPRGSKARSFDRYPADTFSLSASWRVPRGALEGVVLGCGWRVRSKSFATMRGAYVDENLYFDRSDVFDVNAAVPFSVFGGSADWALTLGVRNLFDEDYFESARHYYECLAGEPRTFELGVRGSC